MQLRFATDLSAEQYVRQKAWRDAGIDACPLHPSGGCRFARHGTYARKVPEGTKIARWYCPEGHQTISLLPDCLCSRLSGTLSDVEALIDCVEKAPSQEAAADNLRPEIELPGVLRWLRRRVFLVRSMLMLLIELLPELPNNIDLRIDCFRSHLGVENVLPHLRMQAASFLHLLPPPVGFGPRRQALKKVKRHFQQQTGTDPP